MENPKPIESLRIKIFGDDAKRDEMLELAELPYIKGFTTNPNLMRKAGVSDYAPYAQELVAAMPDTCLSFEVFADEFDEMERQARIISAWGKKVYVKIPVTNTRGEPSAPLVRKLSGEGMQLNITLILAPSQVAEVAGALSAETPSIVSVFAGRVADAGMDALAVMRESKRLLESLPKAELLWASCREVFNIYEAEEVGCEIITVPNDVLKKVSGIGKSLEELSLEGVRAFYADGKAAGFSL